MISDNEATEELAEQYRIVRAPNGLIGNVIPVHSLRPHTMLAHHALYMSVCITREIARRNGFSKLSLPTPAS